MALASSKTCRICHLEEIDPHDPCGAGILDPDQLIAPCGCRGSVKYVHRKCLNAWRFIGLTRLFFKKKYDTHQMLGIPIDDSIISVGNPNASWWQLERIECGRGQKLLQILFGLTKLGYIDIDSILAATSHQHFPFSNIFRRYCVRDSSFLVCDVCYSPYRFQPKEFGSQGKIPWKWLGLAVVVLGLFQLKNLEYGHQDTSLDLLMGLLARILHLTTFGFVRSIFAALHSSGLDLRILILGVVVISLALHAFHRGTDNYEQSVYYWNVIDRFDRRGGSGGNEDGP